MIDKKALRQRQIDKIGERNRVKGGVSDIAGVQAFTLDSIREDALYSAEKKKRFMAKAAEAEKIMKEKARLEKELEAVKYEIEINRRRLNE